MNVSGVFRDWLNYLVVRVAWAAADLLGWRTALSVYPAVMGGKVRSWAITWLRSLSSLGPSAPFNDMSTLKSWPRFVHHEHVTSYAVVC